MYINRAYILPEDCFNNMKLLVAISSNDVDLVCLPYNKYMLNRASCVCVHTTLMKKSEISKYICQ